MCDVAIIGAGVSGLTCAVLFAEAGHRVRIFAERKGRATTSGAAGAMWFPYDAEPADKVIAWSLQTYAELRKLSANPATGVSMIELRQFTRAGEIPIPAWALSLGAQRITRDVPEAFTSGFSLSVPLTDTTRYLDYLERRLVSAGGAIESGVRLQTLDDVPSTAPIIVNCSGVGARELAADAEVEPHRGQVLITAKLKNDAAIVCDDPPLMYAIPRAGDCVFGGTNDVSDDLAVNAADTERIVAECTRVLGISAPRIIDQRVGLRPFRKSGVRIATEPLGGGRAVIHNYGHGGSGFTLSWGCAAEVLRVAAEQAH